jgi:hypothetical protein
MHADALAELILKRVKDIVSMTFSTQYTIFIFYIQTIFAWLSCRPLFFQPKMFFYFFSFPFIYYLFYFYIVSDTI